MADTRSVGRRSGEFTLPEGVNLDVLRAVAENASNKAVETALKRRDVRDQQQDEVVRQVLGEIQHMRKDLVETAHRTKATEDMVHAQKSALAQIQHHQQEESSRVEKKVQATVAAEKLKALTADQEKKSNAWVGLIPNILGSVVAALLVTLVMYLLWLHNNAPRSTPQTPPASGTP